MSIDFSRPKTKESQELSWIAETVRFACERLGVPDLAENIEISFSSKLRRGYAYAKWPSQQIVISRVFWDPVSDLTRRDTVIHEVCHIYTWQTVGINSEGSHGPVWRAAMERCGIAKTILPQEDVLALVAVGAFVKLQCGSCGVALAGPQRKVKHIVSCALCGGTVRSAADT